MSGHDNVIMESEESTIESSTVVSVNASNIGNRRLVSSHKLSTAFKCYLLDEYIWFGKPKSRQMSQIRANSVHRNIVKQLFGHKSTVPWSWQTHAFIARSMIMGAGFDQDHLLIIEFFNEETNKFITMTLYSSENREFFENVPENFDDFCQKLVDISEETASSTLQPDKPVPMVALFVYSPSNHKVLNVIEEGTDVKSALRSLLLKLGIIKDDKLCKVQALDFYKVFSKFAFNPAGFRKIVNDYQQKLNSWTVTGAEHEELLDQIEKTVPVDKDFYKMVENFAAKYLPKREKNDTRMMFLSLYRYHEDL